MSTWKPQYKLNHFTTYNNQVDILSTEIYYANPNSMSAVKAIGVYQTDPLLLPQTKGQAGYDQGYRNWSALFNVKYLSIRDDSITERAHFLTGLFSTQNRKNAIHKCSKGNEQMEQPQPYTEHIRSIDTSLRSFFQSESSLIDTDTKMLLNRTRYHLRVLIWR